MRGPQTLAVALAIFVTLGCESGDRELSVEREAVAPPPTVELARFPDARLDELATALDDLRWRDAMLCPDYAREVEASLGGFASAARAFRDAPAMSEARPRLDALGRRTAALAAELAVLRPALARAARRHDELAAAAVDLSSGFSSLGKAFDARDDEAARRAQARVHNALVNVEAAAETVLSACR